jgi:4-hydroxy-3-polyprenylbenzoate decarboxylase
MSTSHGGSSRRRLVVGMTGASGSIYTLRLLEELRSLDIETHLVVSKAARLTMRYEVDFGMTELRKLADVVHPVNDVAASIASGSFRTMGMVIAPCSVRTLAEIATGVTTTLLTRAADVTLKERRRLVLLVRESPLNLVHLRNMQTVTEMGGVITVPAPSFYHRPRSVDAVVDDGVGRLLDLFDLDSALALRWDGTLPDASSPGGDETPSRKARIS